jgi:hypothetical protein
MKPFEGITRLSKGLTKRFQGLIKPSKEFEKP